MGGKPDDGGRKMNKLPYVWELNKGGIVSHAVGTMHVARNVFEQDAARILSGKKQLLLEINPYEMAPYQKELVETGFEGITDKEREDLMRMLGISMEELQKVDPGMLQSYLFNPNAPHEFPAVDYTLLTKAQQSNLSIISLETPQEKLNYFRNTKPLEKIVKPTRGKPELFELIPLLLRQGLEIAMNAYERGELSLIGCPDISRNRIMVERSLTHLDQPSAIGIGVYHFLLEPASTLAYYEEKGIKVTRVQ